MYQFKMWAAFFIVFGCVQSSIGQVNVNGSATHPLPEFVLRNEEVRQRDADARRKANVEMLEANRRPRQTTDPKIAKEIREERSKRIEEINQKISPPTPYYSRFADFLKNKNTGIARIFPDKNCGKGIIVDVKELERCANTADIAGAGSLYSLRLNEIPDNLPLPLILNYIAQSDIHLIDDKFVVGNSSIQDIIGNVGEVELTDIDAKVEAVKYLREFKPATKTTQISLQKQELEKGISRNGYFYSNSARVKLNNTYVLRSVAYSSSAWRSFWNTDILAVFKVVGQEPDGSVVILWKKLKQKNAPIIEK